MDKINEEIGEFTQVFEQLQKLPEGAGAQLRGTVGNTIYSCQFRQDRIIVSEENPRSSLAEFQENVMKIVNLALKTLGVQFFVAQTSIVRCLFVPSKYEDARVFLRDRLCSLSEEVARLAGSRPIGIFGLRVALRASQDEPLAHNARIESLAEDPSKIWVENVSVFASQPITPASLPLIKQNIEETNRFVEKDVRDFLAPFDTKEG